MIPPYPAALPGAYSLMLQVMRGFSMVEWFKREFGDREVADLRRGIEPEVLDELVRSVPPGSMDLTLQPYWSPRVRIPGPRGQGGDHQLGRYPHPRLYRAILEGLAYALREGAERTASDQGQADRASGVRWRVHRRRGPVDRRCVGLHRQPHAYGASSLGAAVVAAVEFGSMQPSRRPSRR